MHKIRISDYDEFTVENIPEENVDFFIKKFKDSEFPKNPTVVVFHQGNSAKALELIEEFLAKHYRLVMFRKKDQKTNKIRPERTLH